MSRLKISSKNPRVEYNGTHNHDLKYSKSVSEPVISDCIFYAF